MEAKDLRQKTKKQLEESLKKAQIGLLEDSFKLKEGKLKDTNGLKSKRREVARILTLLKEREFLAEGGA